MNDETPFAGPEDGFRTSCFLESPSLRTPEIEFAMELIRKQMRHQCADERKGLIIQIVCDSCSM